MNEIDIAKQIDHHNKNPKKVKGGFKQNRPQRGNHILTEQDLFDIYANQETPTKEHLVHDQQHRMLDQHKGKPRSARPPWVSEKMQKLEDAGHIRTSLLVTLFLFVALFVVLWALPDAHARPAMSTAQATWYGPCCYGNSVACGGKFNENTISLAVSTGSARCGARYKICHKGTCAILKVRDFCPGCKGNHKFDLSAGLVRRVFHVSPGRWGTQTVRYQRVS